MTPTLSQPLTSRLARPFARPFAPQLVDQLSRISSSVEISTTLATGAITPTLGAELLTNGSMESGSPPANWAGGAAASTSSVDDTRTGGSGTKAINVARPNGGAATNHASQTLTSLSASNRYKIGGWIKNVDASGGGRITVSSFTAAHALYVGTEWVYRMRTDRPTGSQIARLTYNADADGQSVRFDDVSLKEVVLSSCLVLAGDIKRSTGNFICHPTVIDHTQAGLAFNYADADNCILLYLDRRDDGNDTVYLNKRIAGVETSVISGTVTYTAGYSLEARVNGTGYSLWYNGFQVGTEQTISDSGLGTAVYGFATDSGSEVGLVETSPFGA